MQAVSRGRIPDIARGERRERDATGGTRDGEGEGGGYY